MGELLTMADLGPDIHLLPQRADAADLVMPSKLTGMLASGRVVATAQAGTEVASVVSGCGAVLDRDDPSAFANAVLALADDAPRRTTPAQFCKHLS